LRRLADDLEILHRLDLRHARGGIDGVARQRDVEALPPDQLSVGHGLRGIRFHRDDAAADGEGFDRHRKPHGRHLEQNPPRLGSHPPHRPSIGLNRVRPAGAALVHGDVGAAHDASGVVVGDVQLVRHHLAECGTGALAAVRLPDVEGGGAAFIDDNPRIELAEIQVRIGAGGLSARVGERAERSGDRRRADAHHEQPRTLQECPPRYRPVPLLQQFFDLLRKVRERSHATPPFRAVVPAIAVAARLMAAWTR
jgi:hypothetical protein